MYNLKKKCQFNLLSPRMEWNKIPTRASILIILTHPKSMKLYIHFVG